MAASSLTSSIGGIYGNNRVVNYGVSKAGMIGLNNVAALEGEAFNVKCNIIAPVRGYPHGGRAGHLHLPANGPGTGLAHRRAGLAQ